MQALIHKVPGGDAGVKRTIEEATVLVKQAILDPDFIQFSHSLVQSCASKDYLCEGKSVFNWVKQNIRYVKDPFDVEMIQSPQNTIKMRTSDCDDFSILLSALYQALGHPTHFVTISQDSSGEFSHIYPEVNINGAWYPADVTPRDSYFGWEPPNYTRKKTWEDKEVDSMYSDIMPYISKSSILSGLSGLSFQDFYSILNPFQQGIAQNLLFQASDYASGYSQDDLKAQDMFQFIRERFEAITGMPYTDVNYGTYSTQILGAMNQLNVVLTRATGKSAPTDDELTTYFREVVPSGMSQDQVNNLLKFYLANYSNYSKLTSQQEADLKASYQQEQAIAQPAFQAVADENTIKEWKNIWANSLPKLSSVSSFLGNIPKYALIGAGLVGAFFVYKALKK